MEEYSVEHLVESNIQQCEILYLQSQNLQFLTDLKSKIVMSDTEPENSLEMNVMVPLKDIPIRAL